MPKPAAVPLDILPFETPDAFRAWLAAHHATSPGIWLRMFKKATGTPSITYAQALDQALCYGWIDGQLKSEGEASFIQRFTPRRAKSGWSKRNIEHVERLTKAGLMAPAGQAAIDAAKADGRWAAAYDSPATATAPPDLLAALAKHKKAKAFFESLNKSNRYALLYRLQTAKKPETRERRLEAIVEMLKAGKKP